MIINFFVSALFVASIAVLWRAIIFKFGNIPRILRTRLKFFSTTFLCGFCFTYWVAFFYLFIFNPLEELSLSIRYNFSLEVIQIIKFIISWITLAFTSVVFRFAFVLLKEAVDHFTHHINPNPNHIHKH